MVSAFIEMCKTGDFQPLADAFTEGMKELFAFIEEKLAALLK